MSVTQEGDTSSVPQGATMAPMVDDATGGIGVVDGDPVENQVSGLASAALPPPPTDEKKLPKGYSYEPVQPKQAGELPSRRSRKQVNYSEMASPKNQRQTVVPRRAMRKTALQNVQQKTEGASSGGGGATPNGGEKRKRTAGSSRTGKRPVKKPRRDLPTTSTPKLDPVMRFCKRVLGRVMRHKHAWPFNVPVDPEKLNLPDYFNIVTEPMDFGTIMGMLERHEVATKDEFFRLVSLVWGNCHKYNRPGSDITVMARILEDEVFKPEWQKVFEIEAKHLASVALKEKQAAAKRSALIERENKRAAIAARKKAPKKDAAKKAARKAAPQKQNTERATPAAALAGPDQNALAAQLSQLTDAMQAIQKQIQLLSAVAGGGDALKATNQRPRKATTKKKPARRQPAKKRAPARKNNRANQPLTHDDKRWISEQINTLEHQHLRYVVKIIHDAYPLTQGSGSTPDMIEIDIDALDTATLRKLEDFVEKTTGAIPPSKNKPLHGNAASHDGAPPSTSKRIAAVEAELRALENNASNMGVPSPAPGSELPPGSSATTQSDLPDPSLDRPPAITKGEEQHVDIGGPNSLATSGNLEKEEPSSESSETDPVEDIPSVSVKSGEQEEQGVVFEDDSSNFSSTPMDGTSAPQILAVDTAESEENMKVDKVRDLNAWQGLDDVTKNSTTSPSPTANVDDDQGWNETKRMHFEQQKRAQHKKEQEEVLRKKLQEDEERRNREAVERAEKEKRRQLDEKRLEEEKRKAQREQARKERESTIVNPSLTDQSEIMASFEENMRGGPFNPDAAFYDEE